MTHKIFKTPRMSHMAVLQFVWRTQSIWFSVLHGIPCLASNSSCVSWGFFSSGAVQGAVIAGVWFDVLLALSWPSFPSSSSSSLSSSNLTRFFSKGRRSFSLALIAKLIGAKDAVNEQVRFHTSLDYSRRQVQCPDFTHYSCRLCHKKSHHPIKLIILVTRTT